MEINQRISEATPIRQIMGGIGAGVLGSVLAGGLNVLINTSNNYILITITFILGIIALFMSITYFPVNAYFYGPLIITLIIGIYVFNNIIQEEEAIKQRYRESERKYNNKSQLQPQ